MICNLIFIFESSNLDLKSVVDLCMSIVRKQIVLDAHFVSSELIGCLVFDCPCLMNALSSAQLSPYK